jgi:hypothetical protein
MKTGGMLPLLNSSPPPSAISSFLRYWSGMVVDARRVGNPGPLGSRNVRFTAVNSRGRRTAFGREAPDWPPDSGHSARKPKRCR